MKRVIALLLVVVAVVMMTSCSQKKYVTVDLTDKSEWWRED